jgi:diguanylate cyclase (GGDEF)-like protein
MVDTFIIKPSLIKRLIFTPGCFSVAFVFILLSFLALTPTLSAAQELQSIDKLLERISANQITELNKNTALFTQLELRLDELNKKQREKYYLLKASYLGLTGQHSQRVVLVNKVIEEAWDPNTLVKFFYQLSDGYIRLGDYEKALVTMNKGIRLLPKLTDINAKVSVLQGATTLLMSLNAFEEARGYANRLYNLGIDTDNYQYICVGLANQVDIKFKLGESADARATIGAALKVCDESGYQYVSDILRSLDAVNFIDMGEYENGIDKALKILGELETHNKNSDYIGVLEEAIARGYYQLGEQDKALAHGLRAFEQATHGQVTDISKKASKTLADIKRAEGDLAAAFKYYDIYQHQRDKVQKDKNVKNLAYQRIKYDNRDKSNQLELLKFKNNALSLSQKLQGRNNENLTLVVLLAMVLLIFMSILLVLSLKQKRALVYAEPQQHQTNDLSGFVRRTEPMFYEARPAGSHFSVIMFELDNIDKLEAHPEDTIGHSLINEVAQVCRDQVRYRDQFSRIGDNRFVLCLLESVEEGAVTLAKRCQEAVAAIDVQTSEFTGPLASTFGIVMIDDEFVDLDEALVAAEKALQLAKSGGINQIFVYHTDEDIQENGLAHGNGLEPVDSFDDQMIR